MSIYSKVQIVQITNSTNTQMINAIHIHYKQNICKDKKTGQW